MSILEHGLLILSSRYRSCQKRTGRKRMQSRTATAARQAGLIPGFRQARRLPLTLNDPGGLAWQAGAARYSSRPEMTSAFPIRRNLIQSTPWHRRMVHARSYALVEPATMHRIRTRGSRTGKRRQMSEQRTQKTGDPSGSPVRVASTTPYWWRWRELNPRPRAFDARIYMLSSPLDLVPKQHDVQSALQNQSALF